MKQYTVTSPHFGGFAELLYNDNGVLHKIDLSNAVMPPGIITSFKAKTPALEANLEEAFKDTSAVLVDADYVITFEMFWNDYNMKRNRDKALPIWDKLSKADQVKAFYSLKAYNKYCDRNAWYNKMYPDTYLRGKHFNDEWNKI